MVGNRTKVKVVKNKVAPPFREVEFDIMYGEGISREGDLLDLAVNYNVVDKSGAWFSYQGERLGQGRENVKTFLKENKEIYVRVEHDVKVKLGLIEAPESATKPAAEEAGRKRLNNNRSKFKKAAAMEIFIAAAFCYSKFERRVLRFANRAHLTGFV